MPGDDDTPDWMTVATRSQTIAISDLRLDPENPRLVLGKAPSQTDLVAKLYEEESLDELVPSFLENGYFAEEPLVVVQDKAGKWVVVEGNRRLATLKLLLGAKFRSSVGVNDWPKLTAPQRKKLAEVPCVIYPDRDSVLPYLGFRHITGPKKWAPYQRARFVAQLLEAGKDLETIEDLIGDTTLTTKKLYQEYVVFVQLTEHLGFSPKRLRERFSLLEVMLGQRPIKRWLGMPHRLPTAAVQSIVPDENIANLEKVAGWVFGTDHSDPVISDSRDIGSLLAPVIDNDESREYLERTGDLQGAFDFSDGEAQFLLRRLVRIDKWAREAAGLFPHYLDDQNVVSALRRIAITVESMRGQID